ncbi:putative membrane protein [Proteiniphilum saccharofermentans]|uniref:Putative membrane protein n=1 Tax=Proteiniphilum saccharofermentans TaxID=1642647 RepID=A0A1R3T1J2_9BACT|nr:MULTISPECIES: DUF4230 domain-containing protein [Proteiniphilum]MDY9917690.1 DUF4230 domain-containing protein [Proteiniphilum sp.]SCD19922.1 putative membrane protein [Proteiniphilum saccharofermentans]
MNTKIRINILTVFFFVLSVILAILLLAGNKRAEKERGYDSSSVMNRISYIQELALVRYNYTGVISYKDYRKFLNINVPLTDKYFLLKYNGYIKAGVDFNRINVTVDNDTTIHISIPKPKILDTVIDEKSIQVYNESENAFNPIKISDYNEAISREKNVMIRDAVEQGIYRQATDEAKIAITSLLREMGFKDIHITEELVMPQLN